MVLGQLGVSLSRALQQMSNAVTVDETVLNECLNDISRALLIANVDFGLIKDLIANVKRNVNLNTVAAGHNKRNIILKAVEEELCKVFGTAGNSNSNINNNTGVYTPRKGKPSVVMFVGLQGSGKTTTCTKRLRSVEAKRYEGQDSVLWIGSDPVSISLEGVARFRKENCDLIIVDTSGRHMQEAALFEEMRQLYEATKPDLVVFVIDGTIGQKAFDQASAFKQNVDVGAVIVTKMDGHAKGGGALSAVAATKSPVIFIGTGEHFHQLEVFNVRPFVKRLLGLGDWSGLVDKIQQTVGPVSNQNTELLPGKDNVTLRVMYNQFQSILRMSSVGDVLSMVPGLGGGEVMSKFNEKENQAKTKSYLAMMQSMTKEELDSQNPKIFNESRIDRIAHGSGREVREVRDLLEVYKHMAKNWSKMKGLKVPKNGNVNSLLRNMNPLLRRA